MRQPRSMCRLVAMLAIAGSLLSACSSTEVPKFVAASGRAPEIGGEALLGGTVIPGDARGKIVVVNFWNYECPPCHLEQPVLQREWERVRDSGVLVIGVMYVGGSPPFPDDRDAARAYLRRFGVTYPAIVDQTSELARGFRILGIPSTIVVDRSGEMRYRLYGRVRPGQLDDVLASLGA